MTLAERLLARATLPEPGLEFNGARCLRRRFIRSTCDLCLGECPTKALYPGEGEVRMESRRCTGCLACTGACPTEALAGRDSTLQRQAAKLLKHSGEVVLCCEKTLRSGKELVLSCLGGVSLEHLAYLAALGGRLEIMLHRCRECHSPGLPGIIEKRRDEIHKLWGRLESPPAIVLHLTPPQHQTTQRAPGGERKAGEKGDERRDFFRAFKALSLHTAAETWTIMRHDPNAKKEQWASSKHPPGKMVLLQNLLEEGKSAYLQAIYPLLPSLAINENCNYCKACVGMCPSGALESDPDHQQNRLLFSWFKCSGCGLCQEFCPPRAIKVKTGQPSTISLNEKIEIFSPQPRV